MIADDPAERLDQVPQADGPEAPGVGILQALDLPGLDDRMPPTLEIRHEDLADRSAVVGLRVAEVQIG